MFSSYAYKRLKNAQSEGKFSMAGKEVLVRVEKVYDGDTITVTAKLPGHKKYHEHSVRLDGIDTPEKARLSRNDPDREVHLAAGRTVSEKLGEKIPKGTILIFKGAPADDKYGRLLGTIYIAKWKWIRRRWVKDTNLNEWLIQQGYAYRYEGGKKDSFRRSFLERIVTAKSSVV